jgi:hypothetical protein
MLMHERFESAEHAVRDEVVCELDLETLAAIGGGEGIVVPI